MLDLIHLRSFVLVAAELHFGRAARRLGMTQPPVSRQIRLLEEYLGVRLFDRTKQAVKLTAAGRNFLVEAQALLQHAAEAEARTKAQTVEHEGEVRLGFYGASSYRLLPAVILRASQVYPRIHLPLRELNAKEQLDAFSLGEIDIGIARPTRLRGRVRAACISKERLVLALPHDHPLARHTKVRIEQLQDEPFIAYNPDAPYLHDMLTLLFKSADVQPSVVQGIASTPSMLSLVSTGIGVAIVPEFAQFASFSSVVFRKLEAPALPLAETKVLTLEDARNPALPLIEGLVKDVGASISARR